MNNVPQAEKKALAKAKLASQSKQAADKKAADARYNSYQAKQKQLAILHFPFA